MQSFRALVKRERLFTRQDRLLLACSGGLDSTVLAYLLHAEGYDFALAHVNYGLRGVDSDGDEAFVRELARTLDARFFSKAVDVKAAAMAGESTQMVARRLRYKYFEKILDEYNYNFVLTAHHAGDNLETALINLIRGTGPRGLAGMRPARDRVRRPLLNVPRERILDYARVANIRWREDASNAGDDYLRNRVRHHLVPTLLELGMTPEGWSATSERLRSAVGFYELGLSQVEHERCERKEGALIVRRTGWKPGELQTFLHERLRGSGFNGEQIRQMASMPGRHCLSSETTTVYVTPESLTFEPSAPTKQRELAPVRITELPFSGAPEAHFKVSLELVPRPDELDVPGVFYLAPLPLPLHLRPRQKGDRFQPLGMRGKHKKVKDYFIDGKVPRWLRDRIYLLTDGAGDIMAIPGYCISEQCKVLPGHREVLRLSWE